MAPRNQPPRIIEDPAEVRPWWVGALVSLSLLGGMAWLVVTLVRLVGAVPLAIVGALLTLWIVVKARRSRIRQRRFQQRLLAAQPTPPMPRTTARV